MHIWFLSHRKLLLVCFAVFFCCLQHNNTQCYSSYSLKQWIVDTLPYSHYFIVNTKYIYNTSSPFTQVICFESNHKIYWPFSHLQYPVFLNCLCEENENKIGHLLTESLHFYVIKDLQIKFWFSPPNWA